MLFFSTRDVPQDADQFNELMEFKRDVREQAVYVEFRDAGDFATLFRNQLEMLMNEILSSSDMGHLVGRDDEVESDFSREAAWLLMQGSLDDRGIIMALQTNMGQHVQTSGTELAQLGDPRSEQTWRGALDELIERGLVKEQGARGEIYAVSRQGFELADHLWSIWILRVLEQLQKSENDYVDVEALGEKIGLTGCERFVTRLQGYLQSLDDRELIESVPANGGIAGARLTHAGRNYIRPYSAYDFSAMP